MAANRSLIDLALAFPEGDAVAARAVADAWLQRVGRGRDMRDARLLLTALCLHLSSVNGPAPTVGDFIAWLEAARANVATASAFRDSPMQLVRFVHAEWFSLEADERSLALRLALEAVRHLRSERDIKTT